MITSNSNHLIFWGGKTVIPYKLLGQLLGMCPKQIHDILGQVTDDFGMANYMLIEERNIYILVGHEYKHLFNAESHEEKLCVDNVMVSAIFAFIVNDMFSYKGLRRVK